MCMNSEIQGRVNKYIRMQLSPLVYFYLTACIKEYTNTKKHLRGLGRKALEDFQRMMIWKPHVNKG
jgi:hypothetical protein